MSEKKIKEETKNLILQAAQIIATSHSIAERYREDWYVVEDRRSGELRKFKSLIENKTPLISDLNTHYKVSFLLENESYWGLLINKNSLENIVFTSMVGGKDLLAS